MLPFAVAAILNTLEAIARPMHWYSERFDGYCFLFATPWAWLLDRGWFGTTHNSLLDSILAAVVIIWISALLYSACIWLLFRLLGFRSSHAKHASS
jgi:hypothetical protein